ncbi:MAG: ABC transporter permease subunit [Isosphaeraceae bacterium]|nr:ABC transporter permease subunit [Isosphaeraceae bacterium]
MTDPVTLVFGPLVVPECRRSAGRAWIILIRTLAGLAAALVALAVLWWWWFNLQLGSEYWPYADLRGDLAALEGIAVTIALLLSPAVLAGSLAGEKERGSLGLLLTTRVAAREIVLGRLAGKMCQVGMILATGLPALVLIAALAGFWPEALATLVALPAAVAFGGGGIALAASATSRRGRDALLAVYLLELLLLLSPLVLPFLPPSAAAWLRPIFPYQGIGPLAWDERVGPALATVTAWCLMGLVGITMASWRLRPSCLRLLSGDLPRRRRGRRWRVPPVNERRPLLWKELYIERVGTLGRFGHWLGLLVITLLVLGSTSLAAGIVTYRWIRIDAQGDDYYTSLLEWFLDRTGRGVSYLIQIAVGLRAAVAISSERERGTWDALMTSPLEGGEIVVGKLWGSLHSLRWLFLAALWAWTLGLATQAIGWQDYAYLVAGSLLIGAFMAAVGVRASLACSTATRAMAVAVGLWLVALGVLAALAAIVVLILALAVHSVALVFAQFGWSGASAFFINGRLNPFAHFGGIWAIVQLMLYIMVTALIVSECRLRFDRIAGRMTGGALTVAVDRVLHGPPMAPVPLDSMPAKPVPLDAIDSLPIVLSPDHPKEATAGPA